MKHLRIFIVTGLSGSGKSTAVAAMEDMGYYCVDNMPVTLLPAFCELPIEKETGLAGIAFVMDVREKGFLSAYPSVFEKLRANDFNIEILFLEAEEEALVHRYSQTRRQHPLSRLGGLTDGIREEKKLLAALRKEADRVIDTTGFTVHDLKREIRKLAQGETADPALGIGVMSFGFKYGLPIDADLVVDVRFLPNPYFQENLKAQSGKDSAVRDFVLQDATTARFLKKYLDLLDMLIPLYETEGKSNLTIAVGCTGGRHRSVVIAQKIWEHIGKNHYRIRITHRDIDR